MNINLLAMVATERDRQDDKFGVDFNGRDPNVWALILLEEVAEVIEASHSGDNDETLEELIQVAAVALSWVEHLETMGSTNQSPTPATIAMEGMEIGFKAQECLKERFKL